MPTLMDFGSFRITMYAGDHNPPHFHIVMPDHEALVVVADLTVLAGSVPGRVLRRAQEWARANGSLLEQSWATLSQTR